ncbi:NUDIX hydrolase [Risungbinella massiliensis]|uniref:NUDIX hydrolase n=1 Tax=Risungbinella massiliensis TaxID=1329796 RepID=UPI0005CC32AA|nr:NUDIX domain-containing protein [Risungbinella massiliensis]
MKEISAGGVVYRKKENWEVLLIQDRYGHITLPKGKREGAETKEENALREIEEETAICGKIQAPILEIQYEYEHPEKGKVDKEVAYFLVEALTTQETPQLEEIHSVAWYSLKDARNLQLKQGYRNNDEVLQKAIHMLERMN